MRPRKVHEILPLSLDDHSGNALHVASFSILLLLPLHPCSFQLSLD